MPDATVIILETRKYSGSEFRVKVLDRFSAFDWTTPDWKKRWFMYEEWLSRLFADEEPFIELDIAANYAAYLVLEYIDAHKECPSTEIIVIGNKGN